jgi:protein-disulfide isomerase
MQKHTIVTICALCCILLGMCGSMSRLAAEDLGSVPKDTQRAILLNPGTPPAGAQGADVTVVEYFDYNCPFCKKLAPALRGLLESDAKVALIYKDWPILSDASAYAAGLALAANWQGKYLIAHDTLMAAPHLASNEQIDALLQKAGLDMVRLKKDREAHAAAISELLQRNDREIRALGVRGTPGLLIGRHIINGVYDVAGLQQAVAIARREGV